MNSLLKTTWNTVFNLTGLDFSFGVKYHDWSFFLIELRADYKGVKEFFGDREVTPCALGSNETILQIIGCNMRQVQIVGSYYEVSIQVPIEPIHTHSGQYFAHLYLPVNSEAPRWAGVDICGFPKFLAQIKLEKDKKQITWNLEKETETILTFSIEDQIGQHKELRWNYYGRRKHQSVLTSFELSGKIEDIKSPMNASLTLGSHPIADKLRELILTKNIERAMIGHQVSGQLQRPVVLNKT